MENSTRKKRLCNHRFRLYIRAQQLSVMKEAGRRIKMESDNNGSEIYKTVNKNCLLEGSNML